MTQLTQVDRFDVRRIVFRDREGANCELVDIPNERVPRLIVARDEEWGDNHRAIHLTPDQARWLAALLLRFAATGELPGEYEEPPR